MKLLFPLIILIILQSLSSVFSQCSELVIVGTTRLNCGGFYLQGSNLSSIASESTHLTFVFSISPQESYCYPPFEGPREIFSLRAYNENAYQDVLIIKYPFSVWITDQVSSRELWALSHSGRSRTANIAVSIDLANNKVSLQWLTYGQFLDETKTDVNFAPGLKWRAASGSDYMMSIGTDRGTPEGVLAVRTSPIYGGFALSSPLLPYLLSAYPVSLIATYTMLEGSGYSIADSVETYGFDPGYFGESTAGNQDLTNAPTWSSSGVKFTARSQYIKLQSSYLSLFSDNPTSFSMSFSIKFDSIADSTIFSRIASDGLMVYGLMLTAAGKLQVIMNDDVIVTSQTPLIANTWHHVVAYFMTDFSGTAASITLDTVLDTPEISTLIGSEYSESASDTWKIGGFLGTMQNLQIFAPSSPILTSPSCIPGCSMDMGYMTPLCVLKTCASTQYLSGQTCLECHEDCATCKGPGSTSCLSCSEPTKRVSSSSGLCEIPPPTPEEPSDEEPTDEEPSDGEPSGEEPSGEEPSDGEPTGEVPSDAEPSAEPEPESSTPTPSVVLEQKAEDGLSSGAIVGIAIGGVAAVSIVTIGIIWIKKTLFVKILKPKATHVSISSPGRLTTVDTRA